MKRTAIWVFAVFLVTGCQDIVDFANSVTPEEQCYLDGGNWVNHITYDDQMVAHDNYSCYKREK